MTEPKIDIRQLTREELFDSITLSEFAFQFELSPEAKEERIRQADPNQYWGYWIDGKLASKLTILDFQTWIGGREYKMGGIAGVATWPEYRRQGMVGKLLRHALRTMRENGQTISMLAPFSFPFYRRYGWESFTEYRKYEIETDKLAGVFAPGEGTVERVPLEPETVGPVYEAYAKTFNGMLKRDDTYWRERMFKPKKGTAAVYRNAAGHSRGYVFYQVRDKVFKVHELVWLDEEARSALWKFIADHDSMMERVELQAPKDDRLPFLLPNPRFKQETVPYFMARIVDVAAFAAQYPFLPGAADVFTLRVRDEHADWNDGAFQLRIGADGQAGIRRLGGDEAEALTGAGYELQLSIQTLSALLVGSAEAQWLHAIGRIAGSAEAVQALAARMPRQTAYLADFF
ncbi:hypothetical protein SD70_30290 [Gordoniibacillus kamchatkensis]|uniref:N-acetyltransferase domain-containing protein n=1 Tax=Gordoniibacillus kamchatkensis TaxID=1590651 RepID=A0ABR5A9Y5_9BACL|nr:GNAT family N-acetyltransferase [Paenibacillus sp. VKM B-2647]KIL37859.1 hypothetical protein SD70_30290 [Paenibacillus sp. VKM B-2647]